MSNEAVEQQTATNNEFVTPEMYLKIDDIVAKYKGKPGSLIPVLQQAQDVCGYLPHAVQRYVAERGLRCLYFLFFFHARAARQARDPGLSRHRLLREAERRDPR